MLIGTHSGTFHCDEALACFMLKSLPEYADASILRTRDTEKLKGCQIVVDVGGTYDPASFRFDHHQKSFNESFSSIVPSKPWKTRLSSAGLIYVHYGRRVLALLTGKMEEDSLVSNLFDAVYENFIEEVDAVDNGVPVVDGEQNFFLSTLVSGRVKNLMPSWNSQQKEDLDALFEDAMKLAGSEFKAQVNFLSSCLEYASTSLPEAIRLRHSVHLSGAIVEIDDDGTGCWKYYLRSAEEKQEVPGVVKFVIGKDPTTNFWRLTAVPKELPHGEQMRASIPDAWKGKRSDELKNLAGNEAAVSISFAGDFAFCSSREGAIELAVKCL